MSDTQAGNEEGGLSTVGENVGCLVSRDTRRGWPLEAAGSCRQRQLMGQRERGGREAGRGGSGA